MISDDIASNMAEERHEFKTSESWQRLVSSEGRWHTIKIKSKALSTSWDVGTAMRFP